MREEQYIERYNRRVSNIGSDRGALDHLGHYLMDWGRPLRFVISGGVSAAERYAPLLEFLKSVMGNQPVIILYDGSSGMESVVLDAWKESVPTAPTGDDTHPAVVTRFPLVAVNGGNKVLEPFFGMSDMQVIICLKKMAERLKYNVAPAFEGIVVAHLDILRGLEIPVSLKGLYYLTSFRDIEMLHELVMKLPCSEGEKNVIWSSLKTGEGEERNQFDMFRAVIRNFAEEARYAGWQEPGEGVGVADVTPTEAMRRNATVLFSMNVHHSDLLLIYFAEELKNADHIPFVLLIDGIPLQESLEEYIVTAGGECKIGLVAENILNLVGSERDRFEKIADKMDRFVLFKHRNASGSTLITEVLLGKIEQLRKTEQHNTSRATFELLPKGKMTGASTTLMELYRVRPDTITGLGPKQAIVFDSLTDRIICFTDRRG